METGLVTKTREENAIKIEDYSEKLSIKVKKRMFVAVSPKFKSLGYMITTCSGLQTITERKEWA